MAEIAPTTVNIGKKKTSPWTIGCIILGILLLVALLALIWAVIAYVGSSSGNIVGNSPETNGGGGSGGGGGGSGTVSNSDNCIENINKNALPYINKVNEAASKYNQDPALMLAQIQAESSFDPNAQSDIRDKNGNITDHAQGIAQFIPGTFSSMTNLYDIDGNNDGKENVWTAEDSIYAQGAYNQYIQKYLSDHKISPSIENVLASYNAGEGAVVQYGGIPPYTETRNYVKRIMSYYQNYKNCLEK